jgi:heavy metal translocating P-type ATPase
MTPARDLCDHCGLPVAAFGYCPGPDARFCCYGCYLAARIVGRAEGGAPAWVLARLGIGAFLAMNVMMVSLLLYSGELQDLGTGAEAWFRWVLLALSTPAMLILGHPFLAGMGREVRRLRPSLDSLVALGSVSAFGVSAAHVLRGAGPIYFDTATMLLALMTVGKLLEVSAKTRAVALLAGLLSDQATEARVVRDGAERTIPVTEVRVGDRVLVRPGERVPVDGEIVSGVSSVHEAQFTGEPGPRSCGPGDTVIGGSVNGEAEITVEARGVGEASLLAQIARLVQQAAARRAPVERLVERVSSVFVPVVAAIAAGALAFWLVQGQSARGAMSALAVLVVACPCALGLATPLVASLAIGRAARGSAIIRSGEALELLPQVSRIFLDKTGTLTRGTLRVVETLPAEPSAADETLAWVATLQSSGEHPVGKAIVAEAARRGLALGSVEEYRAVPGQGAVGTVLLGGVRRRLYSGTQAFVEANGCSVPEALLRHAGAGTLVFSGWQEADRDAEARLCIVCADQLRPEAAAVVRALCHEGVGVTILSGDRREVAQAVAAEAGIEDVLAPCLPDDKLRILRDARTAGQVVAMVGDGVNDAPALGEADVGIALGGGADLAREAGDVTILGDRLDRLPWLIDLARAAYATIRLNLIWAFGYNLIAIGVAFLGLLHPLIAVLVMLASSAFVLSNSLRLARYPEPVGGPTEGIA